METDLRVLQKIVMKGTGLHVARYETDVKTHCDAGPTKTYCHEPVCRKIRPSRRVVYDYSEKVT